MCLTLQQTTFWSHSLAMPGLEATAMRIKRTSSSGLMGQPSPLRAGWLVSLTMRRRTAFTWILQEIGLMGEARMQRNLSANIKVPQKFMVYDFVSISSIIPQRFPESALPVQSAQTAQTAPLLSLTAPQNHGQR